jgi:hypothetical protein
MMSLERKPFVAPRTRQNQERTTSWQSKFLNRSMTMKPDRMCGLDIMILTTSAKFECQLLYRNFEGNVDHMIAPCGRQERRLDKYVMNQMDKARTKYVGTSETKDEGRVLCKFRPPSHSIKLRLTPTRVRLRICSTNEGSTSRWTK